MTYNEPQIHSLLIEPNSINIDTYFQLTLHLVVEEL